MLQDTNKLSLLAGLDLFSKLQAEELSRLAAYMRVAQHPAQTRLFRKGDPGSSMMVVRSGWVKACTHSEDGKELVLNLFKAGDVFGELALLDGADRSADAVTLEPTELLVLERRDFVPFLRRHPDASLGMMEVLSQKLRQATEFLEEVTFREGPSRLARRLVYLAECSGQVVAEGVRIEMTLSQQQLANYVGVSRETVNKLLRQWRDDGMITWRQGRYTILDMVSLRAL